MNGQGRRRALRAARRRRERLPVAAVRGAYLGTRYPDEDVAVMAVQDGQIQLATAAWGENRVLDGELAVGQAAVTHTLAIRQWLDTSLGGIAQEHARAMEEFQAGLVSARTVQMAVAAAAARRAMLDKKLADRGLEPPGSAWKTTVLLGVLGVGDLTLTSVALMVMNISDRPFASWLPVSALQVAAVPIVFGTLTAAHYLGESIKAHRHEPTRHPLLKIIGATALAGGLSLAVSVAAIRTSFLAASGIPALTWPFVGIQLGLFAVATAASAWAAHPYRAEYRRATWAVRRAIRAYRAVRRTAGRLAGVVNALAREHRSLVAQAMAGAEAALSDGKRQGHLYRRSHQHGLPEPVAGLCYPQPVTQADLPRPVTELLATYPDVGPGSHLAALATVSLDDLDQSWTDLQQQLRVQAEARQSGEQPGWAPAALARSRPPGDAAARNGARTSADGNGTFSPAGAP